MLLGLGLAMARANKVAGSTGGSTTAFPIAGATLDMLFTTGRYRGANLSSLSVTRSGTATDLTYDQTARTVATVYDANIPRRDTLTGRGLLMEESRTQYLGLTAAPANQTTSSLGTGSYTLWCIGGTSVSVAANTATISAGGSATPGSPYTFTVSVAGTVDITVTGAVRFFQLENGAFPTSYIPNAGLAGTTVTRSEDQVALTGSALSAVYTSNSAFTLYAEVNVIANANGAVPWRIVESTSGATVFGQIRGGGSSVFIGTSGAGTANAGAMATGITKAAIAIASSDLAVVTNGGTVGASATTVTLAAPTRLNIGHNDLTAARTPNGFVRRVAYVPSRLSNATIQALTTP